MLLGNGVEEIADEEDVENEEDEDDEDDDDEDEAVLCSSSLAFFFELSPNCPDPSGLIGLRLGIRFFNKKAK